MWWCWCGNQGNCDEDAIHGEGDGHDDADYGGDDGDDSSKLEICEKLPFVTIFQLYENATDIDNNTAS